MKRALLLTSLILAACGDAKPVAKAPAAAGAALGAPAAAAGAAATTEAGTLGSEYVYTPIGKRDPFRSFFQDQGVREMIKPNPNCGPLCVWDLDQVRLVAVVSGVSSPIAMVEAPDGRGYVLRRGSFIGKRQGKVSDIRRDAVVVTELIRGNDGDHSGQDRPAPPERRWSSRRPTSMGPHGPRGRQMSCFRSGPPRERELAMNVIVSRLSAFAAAAGIVLAGGFANAKRPCPAATPMWSLPRSTRSPS